MILYWANTNPSTDDIEPETRQRGQKVFRLFLTDEARQRLGHIRVDAKKWAFVGHIVLSGWGMVCSFPCLGMLPTAGKRLPSLTNRSEVISSGPWLDSLFSVLMDAESKQLCLLAKLFISLFLCLSFFTFNLSPQPFSLRLQLQNQTFLFPSG